MEGKGKEMLHDYVCVSEAGPHGLGRGDLKRGDIGGHIGVDSRASRDVQLFWGAHPSKCLGICSQEALFVSSGSQIELILGHLCAKQVYNQAVH